MTEPLGAGWDRDRCNEWFRYHSEISYALTMQRTALESALIPVTAYIVVACVECYRRYPAMVQEIADAVPPEELGNAGHDLATMIDPVRLWAVPNFTLLGRTVIAGTGLLDVEQEVQNIAPVLDFWERAGRARTGSTTARIRRGTRAGSRRPIAPTSKRSRRSAGRSRPTMRGRAWRA